MARERKLERENNHNSVSIIGVCLLIKAVPTLFSWLTTGMILALGDLFDEVKMTRYWIILLNIWTRRNLCLADCISTLRCHRSASVFRLLHVSVQWPPVSINTKAPGASGKILREFKVVGITSDMIRFRWHSDRHRAASERERDEGVENISEHLVRRQIGAVETH